VLVDYALPDLKNTLKVLDLDFGGLVAHIFALESAKVNLADANAQERS
jgi:hypothetical protein